MVSNFSNGYYLTQLLVISHGGDRAIMRSDWLEQYQTKYSDTRPLVMKIQNRHIPVYGEFSVPEQVLAVPEDVFESLDVSSDDLSNVLLAKEETVDSLIRMNMIAVENGSA